MNNIKTFKILQGIIAGLCLLIPIFLRLADNNTGFRVSISNYVYMGRSYLFGMFLCMAAMLFIFNAVIYYKDAEALGVSKHGKWYNIVLGVALLGVILFPHLQYIVIHLIFAGIFFLGNVLVMIFFHRKKDVVISIILSVLVIVALALHFIGLISLLIGEWLSLAVIGAHFILQSVGIVSIDYLKRNNIDATT